MAWSAGARGRLVAGASQQLKFKPCFSSAALPLAQATRWQAAHASSVSDLSVPGVELPAAAAVGQQWQRQ